MLRFLKSWWFFCAVALIVTNTITYHRYQIGMFFSPKEPPGNVHLGVLLPDEMLGEDDEENIKMAKSYLSDYYRWKCVKHGEVPMLSAIFGKSTGFWFQPAGANSSPKLVAFSK